MAVKVVTAKTFTLTAKSGSFYDTKNPSGAALSTAANWDQLYTDWIASVRSPSATTYYVNYFTGNDSTGNGSISTPWKTIRKALNSIAGGDEIIVQGTGTISNDKSMFISTQTSGVMAGHGGVIPNGIGRNARTIIRAETRFGLTISNDDNTLDFFSPMVSLPTSTHYILIDGFCWRLDDEDEPSFMGSIQGTENIITRNLFMRVRGGATQPGWIIMPAAFCLAQDCAGCGTVHYGFAVGGGTGGIGGQNILRRCIGRADYNQLIDNNPRAVFNHYGNTVLPSRSSSTEYQNCGALDSIYAFTDGTYGDAWGGWYNPHYALDIRMRGCFAVNNGAHAQFWCTDDQNISYNSVIKNCLAYGDNATFVPGTANIAGTHSAWDSAPTRGFHCNNKGVYSNLTALGMSGVKFDGGMIPTASNSSIVPTTILHDPNGVDLRFCYGKFGSVFGEDGYDQITSTPLWSYPYEDIIRDWFRAMPVISVSPTAYYPTSGNAAKRGFAADSQTLSRYLAGLTGADPDAVLASLYGVP